MILKATKLIALWDKMMVRGIILKHIMDAIFFFFLHYKNQQIKTHNKVI